MSWAYVFPGQGSQAVGMGKELNGAFAEAREVFEEVDDALRQSLSQLMFEGPQDQLTLTENAQPALMAVSLAVIRVLSKQGNLAVKDTASFVAGHSLGEYSALAASDALSLVDTARLLKIRGQAMQSAVGVGEGAMAALIGLNFEEAQEIVEAAKGSQVCAVANDNTPSQVVVSGDALAVQRAIELAKQKGAKRAVMLSVSAPFHCSLMAPAADAMEAALQTVEVKPSRVPLVANVTAASVKEPQEIKKLLVRQVTGMVRWRESVSMMSETGVEMLIEVGAGKVLSNMTRRINPGLKSVSLQNPDNIEDFLNGI